MNSLEGIRERVDSEIYDAWHDGYEEGWSQCARQSANDYADDWCEGFKSAWNSRSVTCAAVESQFYWKMGCGYAWAGEKLPNYCPNCGGRAVVDE